MIAPDSSSSDLRQALEQAASENARLRKIIQLKDEPIRRLNFRIFGPKSEKLSPAPIPLLLQEISLMAGEVEQEAQRPEAQKPVSLPLPSKPRPTIRDGTSCQNIWSVVKRSSPAALRIASAPSAVLSVR